MTLICFTQTPWLIFNKNGFSEKFCHCLTCFWISIDSIFLLRKYNWSLIFKFSCGSTDCEVMERTLYVEWGIISMKYAMLRIYSAVTFSKDTHDWHILTRTYFTLNGSSSVYSFDPPSLIPKENIDRKLSALPVRGSRNIDLSVDSDQIRCLNNWLIVKHCVPFSGY